MLYVENIYNIQNIETFTTWLIIVKLPFEFGFVFFDFCLEKKNGFSFIYF